MSNPIHQNGFINNQQQQSQQQQQQQQPVHNIYHNSQQQYYQQQHQIVINQSPQYIVYQQPQQLVNQNLYLQQQQQPQQIIKPQSSNRNLYFTLLGLAEKFRQLSNYRLVIHCLESILTIKPSIEANLELEIRFSLCKYYLKYTTNSSNLIIIHLEKAVSCTILFLTIDFLFFFIKVILVRYLKSNDEYKYESTYLIYKFYNDVVSFNKN
jgi:hypothetical protein